MSDEEILVDHYRLTNCIATGSFSQVWDVTDEETGERFAMKMLLEEAFKKSLEKANLKKEFKIAQSFDHQNIIQVFQHRQTRKFAYYIMEYFPGPNIKQMIRGDLPSVHVRLKRMFECVVMSLAHIHEKGWLHRDVKPDNVLMSKASDVRLIDFSLASRAPSAISKMLTRKMKNIQGTRTYIAPEIIRRKPPTTAADIYSLGIMLFECLTGKPPFMGGTPNELLMKHIRDPIPAPSTMAENISPDVDKFVMRLLAKKPEDRHEDMGEVLTEFRTLKLFLADPEEFAREKAARDKEVEEDSAGAVLDSRTDAMRKGTEKTRKKQPAATPPPKPQPKPQQQAHKTPTPQQAPPPTPTQQPVATQPPMPGHYPPQQVPPGYPVQPGMYPGYPPQPQAMQPGFPQVPPQQMPPPQYQQQVPIQQMPPGQVPAQQVPQPQQPPQQKPQSQPPVIQSSQSQDTDDLPIADELPDIL